MSLIDTNTYHGITLYSHPDDHYSHRIRLILAEKNIQYQLIILDSSDEDVAQLNPYATLPMLVDQQIKLFHPATIAEYIDERYRQSRLFHEEPAKRAEQRQLLWRIERDWFKWVDEILCHTDTADASQQRLARQQLTDTLINLAPLFAHSRYFLSDQFSIVDCSLATLFYRLPLLKLHLDSKHNKGLMLYCRQLLTREAFKRSLTALEKRRYADALAWFTPIT